MEELNYYDGLEAVAFANAYECIKQAEEKFLEDVDQYDLCPRILIKIFKDACDTKIIESCKQYLDYDD